MQPQENNSWQQSAERIAVTRESASGATPLTAPTTKKQLCYENQEKLQVCAHCS